jgi:hypothetical protein
MREEDRSLERALQLTRKSSLRRLSVEEMMSRAPDDWQPGEADVDDFLGSLRGGRDRA